MCLLESKLLFIKTWHELLETDKYALDNEPQYNGQCHQKLNYRDLYNILLDIHPNLKLAYKLKEMYRNFNKSSAFEEAADRLNQIIEIFETANLYSYEKFVSMLKH